MDQDYGVREYRTRDLEGRRWAFVTPLTSEDEADGAGR